MRNFELICLNPKCEGAGQAGSFSTQVVINEKGEIDENVDKIPVEQITCVFCHGNPKRLLTER